MKTQKFNLAILLPALFILGVCANTLLFADEGVTVLERVRKIKDPELAELIRIAMDNLLGAKRLSSLSDEEIHQSLEFQAERSRTVRIVTEKYAQIKLLDKKIGQIEKRLSSRPTQDIESEVIMAKVSLETESLSHIAELREAMRIVPWSPFSPKDTYELNTWLHLEILDDIVRVYAFSKPYSENLYENSSKSPTFMTSEETLRYIQNLLGHNNTLPIRITFGSTDKGDVLARDLQGKIKTILYEKDIEYESELSANISRLNNKTVRVQNHTATQVLEPSHPQQGYSIDAYIRKMKAMLSRPDSLPLLIETVYYSEALKDENEKLFTALSKMIDELGLKDYATVRKLRRTD